MQFQKELQSSVSLMTCYFPHIWSRSHSITCSINNGNLQWIEVQSGSINEACRVVSFQLSPLEYKGHYPLIVKLPAVFYCGGGLGGIRLHHLLPMDPLNLSLFLLLPVLEDRDLIPHLPKIIYLSWHLDKL